MVQFIQVGNVFLQKPRTFSRKLLKWNQLYNKREMPWKGLKDPYKIWLSEIILQQTRVNQGLAFYNRFVESFPTIESLANAPDEKVFKLWEGLGYYSRCRNLISTARFISGELNGTFPGNYNEILSLKGVGPYTAAAISSFAFNLPHAVVDGNVSRVLARIFGIHFNFDSAPNKKNYQQLAQFLLDPQQPGEFNQTIMDFGATICKPATPLCSHCPFKSQCYAFNNELVNELPAPKKKISIKKRHFTYLLLNKGNKIAINKRKKKDIWQQLFEFCLVETHKSLSPAKIIQQFCADHKLADEQFSILKSSGILKQQLTHQHISCRFIELSATRKLQNIPGLVWINRNELKNFPFPRIINQYLADQ